MLLPVPIAPDRQDQVCAEILVAHRRAFDDGATEIALSERDLDSIGMMRSAARLRGPTERLPGENLDALPEREPRAPSW